MRKLEELNAEVLEKIKFIDKDYELSCPLLLTNEAKGKILYIGQETNTWNGSHKNVATSMELEKKYNEYYLGNKMCNREFWKFIRNACMCNDIANYGNITWSNLFICSRVNEKGTPRLHNEIEDISVEYILNVIDELKIEKIIAVVGPKNPYYNVLMKLMGELNWQVDDYPTISNPVVYSDNNKLLYSYHPNFLNRIHEFEYACDEARKFIKK